MQKIKEKFASITNNQQFDLAAYELKEMMNNQAVIHTDGYSLNYFCDSDKLVLKSHKNDDVFTHSFKTEKSGEFVNRYFQNKKIIPAIYWGIKAALSHPGSLKQVLHLPTRYFKRMFA